MSGIIMSGTPGNVTMNSTPVVQDWSMSPPTIYLTYVQGQPMPAPVIVDTKIKDVIGQPGVNSFINLRYRTFSADVANLPQCVVMSGDLYTGPVGFNPITESGIGGDMIYSFQNLHLLEPAIYPNFKGVHQIWGTTSFGTGYMLYEKDVHIKIRVFSSVAPVVAQESFDFVRTIGSLDNVSKLINISGESWVIRCPVGFGFAPGTGYTITNMGNGVYEAVGAGSATVQLLCKAEVEPDVITENPLHYTLLVNGGALLVPITVTFLQENGLFLSTEAMNFISYKSVQEAEPQTLKVVYDGNYHLVASPVFGLSASSGSGLTSVVITPMYSGNMFGGLYEGTLQIIDTATDDIVGEVVLTYNVVEMVLSPYQENGFAFTLDNKFLELVSQQVEDTYFDILLKARIYQYNSVDYNDIQIPFKAPLYKRRQSFNIGKVIDKLMQDIPDMQMETSTPYKPAEVNIELTEKKHDGTVIRTMTLDNLFFIAGVSRELILNTCILDINQDASRVTPAGIYYLNMLVGGYGTLKVYKNGEELNTLILTQGIRTFKISFEELGALKGDIFEYKVMYGDSPAASKVFKVFPDGYNSSLIVWENEYKLKSSMEFTGKYTVKSDFENRTVTVQEKLVDVLRKIENTKSNKFSINTGFILKSDIASVESLCRAKRAALVMPGQVVNLVPITKSIVTADDDRELVSFEVEFEINRKYNEEVYTF